MSVLYACDFCNYCIEPNACFCKLGVFFFSFSSFTFLDTNLWPISLTLCSAFAVCLVWLRALYWPVSGHTAGAKPSQDG